MNDSTFEDGSARNRPTANFNRMIFHEANQLRRMPEASDQSISIPLLAGYRSHVCVAQTNRRFDQCIQNRLQIEGRAANDFKHISSSGLLLQGLPQFVEQAGVLDRNDRLGGKILNQLDLLIGERAYLLTVDGDYADEVVLLEHGYLQNRPRTRDVNQRDGSLSASEISLICLNVRNMNYLLCRGNATEGVCRTGTNQRIAPT